MSEDAWRVAQKPDADGLALYDYQYFDDWTPGEPPQTKTGQITLGGLIRGAIKDKHPEILEFTDRFETISAAREFEQRLQEKILPGLKRYLEAAANYNSLKPKTNTFEI